MLNSIVKFTKSITLIVLGIFLLLWSLSLIFGDADNKIRMLILPVAIFVIIYAFVLFTFKMIIPNMSFEVMRFFLYFFLIIPAVFSVVQIISYVRDFPNGFSYALSGCLGTILATLHTAKKNMLN